MRRKGQISVEYVLLIAVVALVAGGFAFSSMYKISSKNIVNSSPKYQKNDVNRNASTVLGPYSSDFISQYNTLTNDPSAKSCTDVLASIMSSLANARTGKMSDQDMLGILATVGNAEISGSSSVSAKDMINNACSSLSGSSADAMKQIESILGKDVITINYSESTCSGKCTITTSSNGLLKDIMPLFQTGQIPLSVFTNVPNSPVSSVPTDIQSLFENYYYVGASTANPGANYMNSITLLNYLYNNNYLPPTLKSTYTGLVGQVKEAVNNDVDKVSYTGSTAHPFWEAVPSQFGNSTSTTSSSTTSSSSKSSPPPFYFCD